ncbi:hypothetical protein F5B20DRAFT_123336 [Whalleya microplaca]|nr:hypothetical protein F5B20DRAFT_123336 [Whalleya microplaca]
MENTTSEPEVVAPGDSKQSYKPPLIRYGEYTAHIPGDKYGKKLRHAGNISHTEDFMRAQNFPRFSDDDFSFEDEEKAQRLRKLLVTIKISFLNGVVSSYADFNLLHDTREEKTVDFSADSLSLRVTQLRKVAYTNQVSYYTTNRASKVDIASNEKMKTIETAIGRDVQTLLMARVMGLADLYPGEKSSLPSELTRSKTGEQYKALRANATRSFWLDYNRDERKILRKEAQNWPSECRANVRKIQKEDLSVVEDDFFQHKKDWMAASDPNIYPCVDKDIYLVLDKDGNPILCSVSQLFQRLFGEAKMHKVVDAVKKWSELPPLPEPNTTRNMANEMIRRDHPELNMELAKSPEELMQRAACLVHYGTWSMPGPMNPDTVYLTADTLLQMGGTEKATPNFAAEAMPSFRRGVLGLSSELVRFILRSIAPEEYKDYVEIFEALPNEKRISLSHPNFFTMAELGINTFTGRHRDRTDTKNGLAGLVPLGTYTGFTSPPPLLNSFV